MWQNAISITKEAKELFTKLVREARHTLDDISCVDVSNCYKKVNGGFEDKPTDVCVSYLGDIIQKFNVEECIHDEEFFIGCGEGSPKIWLLDELVAQ